MANLEKISNGLNWKVFQKRQMAIGFEFETDDEFIELTYERFQKEWEEVAEISIDQQKLQEFWGGDHSHKGGFLFFITNSNPYGEWTQKFSKPFEEELQLDEESLSAYELDMKTPRARSTSVGDIYQDLDNNLYFMIMSVGFKQVRLKNRIDSDSARAQSKKIQSFPQGFQEANKMWKSILKNEVAKMMTPLDALDEVAILISNEADYPKLKMWLDRAKRAGHVTMPRMESEKR